MNEPATIALRLAILAMTVAAAVSLVAAGTESRIAANRYRASLDELASLSGEANLAGTVVPNPLPADFRLCPPGRAALRILRGAVPGYGGTIEFLIAIGTDARVRGVRVTRHAETPGIGDAIDERRSDWILGLGGLPSRGDAADWALRSDGGAVDAISGATITSRALLEGIRASLDQAAAREVPPCPH